jgi:hypothetical protein
VYSAGASCTARVEQIMLFTLSLNLNLLDATFATDALDAHLQQELQNANCFKSGADIR